MAIICDLMVYKKDLDLLYTMRYSDLRNEVVMKLKRYRLMYSNQHCVERFILANSMMEALQYALRKDVRGQNAFGDIIAWGEIDRVEIWDAADVVQRECDEAA